MGKRKGCPQVERTWDGFASKEAYVMEEIWRELPFDLQMRLLPHLPLPSLSRFQAVSRAWYQSIRALEEITTHGECYLMDHRRPDDVHVLVHGSLEKGPLKLPFPVLPGYIICSCPNGLLCLCSDRNEINVCHVLTGQVFPITSPAATHTTESPDEMRFLGIQTGEQVGDASILFVLVNIKTKWLKESAKWGKTRLHVYKHGGRGWKGRVLPLDKGEDVAALHQATLCGSMLYFLTVRRGSREVCLRSMDVFKDRLSTKITTWTSLPCGLRNYGFVHRRTSLRFFDYEMKLNLSTRLVVVEGNLLMAIMKPGPPAGLLAEEENPCGVGLLRFDKQGNTWELLSQMPIGEGFPTFNAQDCDIIFITSHKGKLFICNELTSYACTYNVSSNVWSPLGIDREKCFNVVPLQLSYK